MLEYLFLLLSLMRATMRDREALVAENLLLRQQLAVLTRPTRRRPRLRARDKLFWVLARVLHCDWRRYLALVRPESVIRWHRQAWRLFWRWRSRGPIGQGLPAILMWRPPTHCDEPRARSGGQDRARYARLKIPVAATGVQSARVEELAVLLDGHFRTRGRRVMELERAPPVRGAVGWSAVVEQTREKQHAA